MVCWRAWRWGEQNDDTLIFCKCFTNQLKLLRCVIRFLCFEVVSGLKINLIKSYVYGVGKVDDLGRMAAVLGCKMGAFLFNY